MTRDSTKDSRLDSDFSDKDFRLDSDSSLKTSDLTQTPDKRLVNISAITPQVSILQEDDVSITSSAFYCVSVTHWFLITYRG